MAALYWVKMYSGLVYLLINGLFIDWFNKGNITTNPGKKILETGKKKYYKLGKTLETGEKNSRSREKY